MADRVMRRTVLAMLSLGLVCHTNAKNLGRFCKAENLSFNVTDSLAFKYSWL